MKYDYHCLAFRRVRDEAGCGSAVPRQLDLYKIQGLRKTRSAHTTLPTSSLHLSDKMVFGFRMRSHSSERNTFYDAENGSGEHVQHAGPSAVHNDAGAIGQADRTTDNGVSSSNAPEGNGLHNAEQDFIDTNHAINATNNGKAKMTSSSEDTVQAIVRIESYHTGVGPDPFVADKAPGHRTASPTATDSGTVGGASVQRKSTITGTFANGAGTSGPAATPEADASHQSRIATAEEGLTDSVVAKLGKVEGETFVRVLRVIVVPSLTLCPNSSERGEEVVESDQERGEG